MIDEKYLSEIEEFHKGDWIVWVGEVPEEPRAELENWAKGMGFILDGKPHKVKDVETDGMIGGAFRASFFDSPNPGQKYFWGENIHNMRKVDAKAILKDLME